MNPICPECKSDQTFVTGWTCTKQILQCVDCLDVWDEEQEEYDAE